MAELILVTGGARSGKSTYAEKLAAGVSDRALYIATAVAFDEEMQSRIRKHQESRPSQWATHEGFRELGTVLEGKAKAYDAVLLDCVTVMLTNLLWTYPGMDFDNPAQKVLDEAELYVREEFTKLLEAAKNYHGTLIMVTNEVGSGLVPESSISRSFRDIAGRINQQIAAECNQVFLAVCGIPVRIK